MPVIFTETWPEGYKQMYAGYLYNYEAFVPMQGASKTGRRTFYAIDTLAKGVVGKVHFFKEFDEKEVIYHSPLKSPFGSFELHGQLSAEQTDAFVQYALNQIKKEHPARVHLLHHPTIYHPDHTSWIKDSLLKAGFGLKGATPNHHIMMDRHPLENKMHTMEKRRWRKCQKAGFSFKEEPLPALNNIYDFVKACREERGWGLSMTLSALQNAVAVFPENYKLFSVYDGGHRIAATIAIVVNSRILYNFYPASLLRYQSYSPTVMLVEGVYRYCQRKGMKILDLGTSASPSLQRFKEHMGGEVSYKYDFIYPSGK